VIGWADGIIPAGLPDQVGETAKVGLSLSSLIPFASVGN
jgi:hypothetical protein